MTRQVKMEKDSNTLNREGVEQRVVMVGLLLKHSLVASSNAVRDMDVYIISVKVVAPPPLSF